MKTFTIYEHPALNKRHAVKNGWSWPAFFLPAIWLLVKRMWLYAFLLLALFFVFGAVQGFFYLVDDLSTYHKCIIATEIVGFLVAVWFGCYGNRLYSDFLENRGYRLMDTVEAKNPDAALAVYFEKKR